MPDLRERQLTPGLPDRSGATSDAHLVELWLAGRSPHTQRAYRRDTGRFFAAVRVELRAVTVDHVVAFAASLTGAASSQGRVLSSVKSLLSFGHATGYLAFNVGTALRLPKAKNTLAERILPEADVHKILALEPSARNRALLTVLYGAGIRVSEAAGLKWRDTAPRDRSQGQLTVHGKGGKTRAIMISAATWSLLCAQRLEADHDAPVFRSRQGGHLTPSAIWKIVRKAARRAGIEANVSPHWFRHAHASHALDRGAPAHLLQQTLGHASLTTTSRYAHARPNESSSRYLPV